MSIDPKIIGLCTEAEVLSKIAETSSCQRHLETGKNTDKEAWIDLEQ
jgi:hypothetical protein